MQGVPAGARGGGAGGLDHGEGEHHGGRGRRGRPRAGRRDAEEVRRLQEGASVCLEGLVNVVEYLLSQPL